MSGHRPVCCPWAGAPEAGVSSVPRVRHRARPRPRGAGRAVRRLLSGLALIAAGCGSGAAPQSEDYGNLLASPEGLVIVESEHPSGWTRPDCFACHNVNNIHQVNRTGLPDAVVDLKNVRAIVRSEGEASCSMCHGDNGVRE